MHLLRDIFVKKKQNKAGFKIYPWTINEIEDIDEMIRLGVDAIITDFPERVKR